MLNKKGLFCFSIVLAIFLCYVPTVFGSSTISPWAENDVNEAISLGLIQENMRNNYTENITRTEFCRLMVILLEKIYDMPIEDILSQRGLTPDNAAFVDTQDTDILAANALGIVFGDGKGNFNPHGEIKRCEAAAMLMRTTSLTGEYHVLPHVFDDAAWLPEWARESTYAAYAYGIMVGDNMNRFHPVSFYTRQETYATILRLYNTIKYDAKEQESLYPMSAKNEEGIYLWGYINQNGIFVIEQKYAYASEWSGQYGIVSLPDAPDAYIVIDREENHVIEVDVLREQIPEKVVKKTPPLFLGNTLLVGEHYKYLFSLPDGKWLAGDFKYGGAIGMTDGIIPAVDGFNKRWYYLDRNGRTIIPMNEGFRFGGYFFMGKAIIEDTDIHNERIFLLWSKDEEKKPVTIDLEKYFPQYWEAVGDLMVVSGPSLIDESYNFFPTLYGVVRADGKEILPSEYETLSLTPGKQILARKNATEPYQLFDETGKEIYEFNSYFDGNLQFDGIAHYMYRSGDTMLTVLSNTGAATAFIELPQDSNSCFISGLIQISDNNGACIYYTVDGKNIFLVR